MRVTATQAKNRFGAICAQAKIGPVFVEKGGHIDTVIMSATQFTALQTAAQCTTHVQGTAQFKNAHQAWIAEQNARFQANGLWFDDLNPSVVD